MDSRRISLGNQGILQGPEIEARTGSPRAAFTIWEYIYSKYRLLNTLNISVILSYTNVHTHKTNSKHTQQRMQKYYTSLSLFFEQYLSQKFFFFNYYS